jgi:hypothetical protein
VPRLVKAKWGAVRRTLRQVAGAWLPNEACVELALAEVLSAIELEAEPERPVPLVQRARAARADLDAAPAPTPAVPVEPSPFVLSLLAGLEDASPRELDRRLCRAAALERGWLARVGALLLTFADLGGPRALGFRSLDGYARERLAMSARKARVLLRLERACRLAPVLGEAWHSGRITVSEAQALVPLLLAPGSEPFHAAWIKRAGAVTVRRLEDDVEHALASGTLDPSGLPALPDPAGVQTGAQTTDTETDVWVANVPSDVARLFRACLHSVARRLNRGPGAAFEAMLDHAIESWRVPMPRAHSVFERDGWRCQAARRSGTSTRTTCCSAPRAVATTSRT